MGLRPLVARPGRCVRGYVGVSASGDGHPLGSHYSAGWRLHRAAWGKGFAVEAARAVLDDAFSRVGLDEVLAYTGPDNARSRAVMGRLGLSRRPDQDFTLDEGRRVSSWLTWAAAPAPTETPG
ncbi:GNAT family N-acetyltransferase [Phenylobacterium terrae]|uniref:GNAT family N-acetyltransferase n=1 Tax=Phenylobacterium terrae TaxID=2665495 RepID=A0ABW4N5H0_9CAUL